MIDEQPRYNRLVNPDATGAMPSERSGPQTNPWLVLMAGLGVVSFVIGLALYDSATDGFGDVALHFLWASILMGFGVMLVVSAMASAAICWQLERGRASS